MNKTLQSLLASNTPPQSLVTHFFYFPSKVKMQACTRKLTAHGFEIQSAYDRDVDKPANLPIETDVDVEVSNQDFDMHFKMGIEPPNRPEKRSARPWSLIATATHSVDEGFWEIHCALNEIALALDGDYDGHEYRLDEES